MNIKETIHQEPFMEGYLHIAKLHGNTKNMDRNEWLAEKE